MELLTIIVIVAVMSSVLVPAGTGFHASEQTFAAAAKLTAHVRMARYRAMEYQSYQRIDFEPGGDGWQVRELCDSVTNEAVTGEPCLPTHNEWQSILGEEFMYLEPSITMTFDPDPPPSIYFRPDGLLVSGPSFNSAPLGILKVSFFYSDHEYGAVVDLSPAGAIESKAFYREDVDDL